MVHGWCKRISALLIIAPLLSAQVRGTLMLLRLDQPESPAAFIQMTHGKDYLESATLQNVGTEPITEYRIGWVEVYPCGKSKIGLGYRADVPEGIDPTKTTEIPAQGVSDRSHQDGATAVVFFVAEVRTATGTGWKADLDRVERDARGMAESNTSLKRPK